MATYYVVGALQPWGSLKLEETGKPLRCDEPYSAGYMSVYTTREAAEACIARMAIPCEVFTFEADERRPEQRGEGEG